VDRDYGGFLCDFDHRWRPSGAQSKMLEFQARQTISAARAATHSVHFEGLRDTALHGLRYLKDTMWDRRHGGWYHLLDRKGVPAERATKHGHGSGYALSACAVTYQATGERDALELAQKAFGWLEEHAHDREHGGYFVFYQEDGTPILSTENAAVEPGEVRDAIRTPVGYKDANTTCDLLKGLSDLYRVWPDAQLKARVEEILCIVRDRLVVAPGLMHMYLHRDWVPLPDPVRYGQIIRAVNILLATSSALYGAVDSTTARVCKSMIDTMLRIAWDPDEGGFHLAGSSFGPDWVEDVSVLARNKVWWVQADGLKALLSMSRLDDAGRETYISHAARVWEYVKARVIDTRHGGWLYAGLDTNPEATRRPKATAWKDSSHETEALIDSMGTLSLL
jgi:mannobiose 2-epimerase